MEWYQYVAYFFSGLFFTNAVPHFVKGVCGEPFPTPFAKPPGKGKSSPLTNVLWGSANAVVGYVLITGIGSFAWDFGVDVLVFALGALAMAVMLARHFGSVYAEG